MLARLVADHDPAFLACATDEDWRPEWRVELLPDYKSARALPGSRRRKRRIASSRRCRSCSSCSRRCGFRSSATRLRGGGRHRNARRASEGAGRDRLGRPRPVPARARPERLGAVSEEGRLRPRGGERGVHRGEVRDPRAQIPRLRRASRRPVGRAPGRAGDRRQDGQRVDLGAREPGEGRRGGSRRRRVRRRSGRSPATSTTSSGRSRWRRSRPTCPSPRWT